jgi:uncharacterized membrane protein
MHIEPRRLGSIFLTGLVVLLPITVTLLFLNWLLTRAEGFFGSAIAPLLGDWYRPGMGMVLGLAFVFLVGLLAQLWIVRKLIGWGDDLLERIPLIKTVYGGVRDLLALFRGGKPRFNKVVLVRLPGSDFRLVGFVTREDFAGLPAALGAGGAVAVYMPMSYQIGGYTVLVPREQLEPLDMSFEDAMRYTVTAGLSVGEHKHDDEASRRD